ncbi:basic proline-rich protein-like, partial [Pezoporus wallicus]|uniref:basic proline-rich protein-like n=1 Tax=Pezoporus wallicus TaxID=35540 RepID=UPI00254B3786
QGPPRPGGGCRLRVTLGTVTLALPQPGWAPPPGDEQLLWGVLGGGHALPIPHLRLQLGGAQGGLELGGAGGPRGHLGVARMELTEELPGAEPHRLQVLRFPPASPPTQPCLRLRYGPPAPPGPGEPPLKEPPPPRELSLELGPMESDLDLGLIERFGPALAFLSHAPSADTPSGEWAWPRLRWAAPRAVLRLRLPRVDLRPPPLRGPPPSLRPESLRLELGGPRGAGGARGGALVCTRLLVVYEAEDMGSIPCLCVEPGPGPGGTRNLPMLEVTVPDPPSGAPPGPPLSPFSAQRSIYESHE